MICKLKMISINQGGKPVLKYFIIKLNFYKNNFETRFCQLTHFTRKLVQDCYACICTYFSRHDYYMEFWELVGIECRTFGRESVNSV